MSFAIPSNFAEAQQTLASLSGYVSGKNAIFYSGPLDENGNSTGANRLLAEECAKLYPDNYYTISDTEVGQYLDFLFREKSLGHLSADFTDAAMAQLGTQGSQQYSASAVGGYGIVFSDGPLRPGNDFYNELEVQFSETGQLQQLNGIDINRLKTFTNGNVEQAAQILGKVSDCYPPSSPTPGGAAVPVPEGVVDETWKVAAGIAGVLWGWALAAEGTVESGTAATAQTVVSLAGKAADLFVKTAAAILPFGIAQAQQKAEAAGTLTSVATQMQVRSMVAKGDLPPEAANELPPLTSFVTLSGKITFTAESPSSSSVAGGTIVRKDDNGNVQSVTEFNVDSKGNETSTVATYNPTTGSLVGIVNYTGSGTESLTPSNAASLDNNAGAAPAGTTVGANDYYVSNSALTAGDIAALVGIERTQIDDFYNLNNTAESATFVEGTILHLPSVDNTQAPTMEINPSPTTLHDVPNETSAQDNVGLGFADWAATHHIEFNDGTMDGTDLLSMIRGSMATGGARPGEVQIDPFAANMSLLGPGQFLRTGAGQGSVLDQSFIGSLSSWSLSNGYYVDPILLDLTGNGIGTTSYKENAVLFDMDHSGTLKRTSWTDEQTGMLVVPDQNGNVTNVSQLFSEYYGGTAGTNGNAGTAPFYNGFDALSSVDSDHNGVIDSSDSIWSQLRVWVDANHDAKVDSGELKTLSSLGITRFKLGNFLGQGTNNGNPITATSTFTMNGNTRTMSDINLTSDDASHTFTALGTGTLDTTVSKDKDGNTKIVKTYRENSSTNSTMNAATLHVDNIYGGDGNDTLVADADGSWLIGGQGSNTYQGGVGNDVFIVSASDDPSNIQGNGGTDTLMVGGNDGMTINMAQVGVTIAEGGAGDDVIMSGGRAAAYIQGGSGGNDLLIGGAGDDVITGGSGHNTIIGGTGKAVIYAGSNGDLIYGAKGDSIINAGKGADTIIGGAGNDVIKVGMGNAQIDGGGGTNIVEFHGSYGDYKITQVDNGYWISDKVPNRDGTVFITNVQKLNFVDIQAIDINSVFAMPVKDTITKDSAGNLLDRTQAHLISAAQLLANDQKLSSSGSLHISAVSNAVGGAVSLTQAGDVLFTPDPTFTGIMSFKYTVADAQGHSAMNVQDILTGQNAIMKAKVTLATPDVPTDPLTAQEWYLTDVNVLPVWKDYTGKGVRVGQFEPGGPFAVEPEILNYNHPDLAPNIDIPWYTSQQVAGTLPTSFSNHATMVAGIITAAKNGTGAIGVAYDAKLAGEYFDSNIMSLGNLAIYDVANNSWSSVPNFAVSNYDPNTSQGTGDFILANAQYAAYNGRGGKGTVIVESAGNGREKQETAQGSLTNNNRFGIQVGGINEQGDLSTLDPVSTPFSNPGASLLVSAPASNMASSSQLVITSQGSIYGDTTQTLQGTSFATPIVSGIVALMLEANPNLGYRDVQEILALTARKINDPNTTWATNGGTHWNGGGMHTSQDYGFGDVDALAAVRLAETWLGQKTGSNESVISASTTSVTNISAGGTGNSTLSLASGLQVEHAEVDLDLAYGHLSDLIVKLISPNGTESILLSGNDPDNTSTSLKYTFMSTHDWGEKSGGNWTLRVTDATTGSPVTMNGWALRLYGSTVNINDTYVYTNEFASQVASNSARAILNDSVNGSAGGINTINAAAMTGNTTINLSTGSANLGGTALTIQSPSNFNNIFTGDGNDTLTANGNKSILDGGRGTNTLTGGAGKNIFVIHQRDNGLDTINGFTVSQSDKIDLVGFTGKSFSDLILIQQGSDVSISGLGGGQSVLVKNMTVASLTSTQFAFQDTFIAPQGFIDSSSNNDTLVTGTSTITLQGGFNNTVATDTSNGRLSYSLSGTVYRHDLATSDKFVINNPSVWPNFNNALQGFKPGIDKIDLSVVGISDAKYLTLKPKTYVDLNGSPMVHGTEVTIFDGTQDVTLVYLDSIDATQLKASDFIFTQAGDSNAPLAVDRPVTPAKHVPLDTDGSTDPFIVGSNAGITSTTDGSGNVRIHSSVNYVLPDTINNLELTGNANLVATGNNNANAFTSNQGVDTFIGSLGNDTYFINNTNDVIIENANEGTDSVQASASFALGDNVENLTLTGTADINGTGNTLNNQITGNSGANILDGGIGNDILDGGLGNDTYSFAMGYGVDTITDAGGTDTLDFSAYIEDIGVSLSATTFNDGNNNIVSWATNAIENLTTGSGNDYLNGNTLNNVLNGGDGNDTLVGLAGNDTLDGGIGDDSYLFANGFGSDSITDAAGNDTLDFSLITGTLTYNATTGSAVAGTSSVTFNPADTVLENIIAGSGNDSLTGSNGSDNFTAGAGNDTLDGGAGNDTYLYANGWGADSILDASGIDTVDLHAATIALNVNLGASAGNEVSDGTNTINWATSVIENVITGSGNDTVNGTSADNRIVTGAGSDAIWAGLGNDTIDGGDGNDRYVYTGAWGNDSIIDSSGTDQLDFSTDASNVIINLTAGAGNEVTDGTSTLNWTGDIIENVKAGTGNDSITGSSGANSLNGGLGNDTLNGGLGNDTLDGGAGDDVYQFLNGFGVDSVADISGNDTFDFSQLTSAIIYNATTGSMTSGSNSVNFAGVTIENVLGGTGADSMTGGSGSDSFTGGAGNDTLDGGNGNDTYFYGNGWGSDSIVDVSGIDTVNLSAVTTALNVNMTASSGNEVSDGTNLINWSSIIENLTTGSGNDTVNGTSGDNYITLGAGSDAVWGALGNDTLDGGDGNDRYVYTGAWGNDSILDASGTDTLDFRNDASNLTVNLTAGAGNEATDGTSTINWTGNIIENVWAGTGTNVINGNSSANSLIGNIGLNTLNGGAGNDTLQGGTGNSTYQFALGDGQDTITETGGTDMISFNSSVIQSNIALFQTSTGNLQVGYTNSTGDLVTIQGQTTAASAVEKFQLSNGNFMTNADVNSVIQAMTSYAASHGISLTSITTVENNADLMNIVNSGWHA